MMNKIVFDELNKAAGVYAFFTTKEIGSWNYTKPDGEALYRKLAEEMHLPVTAFVRTKQTHTSSVKIVTSDNGGEGCIKDFANNGYDGMITNAQELVLCTVEADCVPVLLADPVQGVIGNVHSGWRGTAGQISGNAVRLMQEQFGTLPKDIFVGIGPCICEDCYEVSQDLIPSFAEVYSEEEIKQLFLLKPNGKYLLNLKLAIKLTLLKAGVNAEHIFDSGYCTYHQDIFDSYRKNGGKDLRILSAIKKN